MNNVYCLAITTFISMCEENTVVVQFANVADGSIGALEQSAAHKRNSNNDLFGLYWFPFEA